MNYKCKQGFQSVSLNGYCYKSTVIDEKKYKSLRIWEQLYFNAMYETPSATFEIPVDPEDAVNEAEKKHYKFLNDNYEENGDPKDFLSDYKPPEPDYDHWAEQFQVDQDRRAAEDYERQLDLNSR